MYRLICMVFVADLIACRLNLLMSAVACRLVAPRLWSGFLVWLLQTLLLAGWCGGFCGVRVSKALAACLFSCLFCLLKRGSVYKVLNFDQTYIAFVCFCVSWFDSQGVWIGRAICSVISGNSSCIIGRPSLIHVCWVLFGAWLLSQSNDDCIWLAKFLPLLCIEIEW